MPILANITPYLLFLLGCGLLTALLLRRSHRYFKRNRQECVAKPGVRITRLNETWKGAQSDASAAIDRQKIELHDLARDAAGQLNTKMLALQNLMTQSEQQIERMEELITRLDGTGTERD